jgi:hypothetical protein
MTNIEGIISVEQLRSEIGSPTSDVRDVAAVSDDELKGLIQRFTKNLHQSILSRLEKKAIESVPHGNHKTHEKVTIHLESKGAYASNNIPDPFYPITFFEAYDPDKGKWFEYDPNMQAESTGFFERRRFRFSGENVMVIPSDTDRLELQLPKKNAVHNQMGDLIGQTNSQIIKAASRMVELKTQRGQRLEQSDLDQ